MMTSDVKCSHTSGYKSDWYHTIGTRYRRWFDLLWWTGSMLLNTVSHE